MPLFYFRRPLLVALIVLAVLQSRVQAQFNDILGGKGLAPGGDTSALAEPQALATVSAGFTAPATCGAAWLVPQNSWTALSKSKIRSAAADRMEQPGATTSSWSLRLLKQVT